MRRSHTPPPPLFLPSHVFSFSLPYFLFFPIIPLLLASSCLLLQPIFYHIFLPSFLYLLINFLFLSFKADLILFLLYLSLLISLLIYFYLSLPLGTAGGNSNIWASGKQMQVFESKGGEQGGDKRYGEAISLFRCHHLLYRHWLIRYVVSFGFLLRYTCELSCSCHMLFLIACTNSYCDCEKFGPSVVNTAYEQSLETKHVIKLSSLFHLSNKWKSLIWYFGIYREPSNTLVLKSPKTVQLG